MKFIFHNRQPTCLLHLCVNFFCPGICESHIGQDSHILLSFSPSDSSLTSPSLPSPLSVFSLAVTLAHVGVWGPAGAENKDRLPLCHRAHFSFLISFRPKWMKCVGLDTGGPPRLGLYDLLVDCWRSPLHQHFQWAGARQLRHLRQEITFFNLVMPHLLSSVVPCRHQKAPVVVIHVEEALLSHIFVWFHGFSPAGDRFGFVDFRPVLTCFSSSRKIFLFGICGFTSNTWPWTRSWI